MTRITAFVEDSWFTDAVDGRNGITTHEVRYPK